MAQWIIRVPGSTDITIEAEEVDRSSLGYAFRDRQGQRIAFVAPNEGTTIVRADAVQSDKERELQVF